MIGIVDCGVGNISAVKNMVSKVGGQCAVINDPEMLRTCDAIILPGVGTFDYAMQKLESSGFKKELELCVAEFKTPLLGVCIGMHLLFSDSEEGEKKGFGWIRGSVKKFKFDNHDGKQKLKIPHMGWNTLTSYRDDVNLINGLHSDSRFYFVHSYHVIPESIDDIVAECNYGYRFPCIVQKENIYGVQFHPEKSHKFGMKLFENFLYEVKKHARS